MRPDRTFAVAGQWGGPVSIVNPVLGSADDTLAHIIAGDIVSPEQNEPAFLKILSWIKQL